MKQADFERRHVAEWTRLSAWLDAPRQPRAAATPPPRRAATDASEAAVLADIDFPAAYRRLCQQLALAERRSYSVALVERLRRLAERGHLVMYRPPRARWLRIVDFFAREFPQRVRAQPGTMSAAALLFFLPLFVCMLLLQYKPELSALVIAPAQLAEIEAMYDPAAGHTRLGRDSGSDLQMFGYYILNNVSIGFRSFASGLLAGIGAALILLFNGVMIGTVAGHLTAIGYGDPFWRFVAGHSAPELLGIVIAGGAGLRLGLSLLMPGQRTRARAFREEGTNGAKIVLGVFAMLVFAAFVEAFWSSIGWMPALVKYGVGISMWALMLGWLLLAGRGRGTHYAD
jgi:uncharacterized membrane protein SpoIIM required for sporulation